MSQNLPATLGKYQIIREIARSNDIVYEAYDPVMNRRVAIKELSIPSGSSQQQVDDRIRRFLREAKAAGSLVQKNIVTIYEFGEDSGRRFIAMEYLDGQNLRNLLDTRGFIEPKRALKIAIEVLNGLEFAHEHGVIHRDIKPDNIQLLENGDVKITDFGIARLTFEPNLTLDGQVFGTPSYMSPEQINGRELDARSDLFSVGVILYEMLSGSKPFVGDNVVSISMAIINQTPTQPSTINNDFWNIIAQALEKSPQLRWGSASEMAKALERALVQQDIPSTLAQPSYQQPSQQPYQSNVPPIIAQQVQQYGMPYGSTVHPQQFGQPYHQQQNQTLHQQQQGQQQLPHPYIRVPVYYPKYRVTVSPETKIFLGRILTAFLFIGTIAGVVLWLFFQGTKAFENKTESPKLPSLSTPAKSANPSTSRRTAKTIESVISVESAQNFVDAGTEEPDSNRRSELWTQATSIWSQLIQSKQDSFIKTQAVDSFLSASRKLQAEQKMDSAAEALYQAEGLAQGDEELMARVRQAQIEVIR